MKQENLLWKVLRATTNSPNDVWKPRHYQRHKGIRADLLNSSIRRYTVPIMKVCDIKDDTIYLVVQFCTDELEFPYFVIDKSAFTKDIKAEREFVYAINIRLCFKSEFKIKKTGMLTDGKIKEKYRANVLNSSLNLIRNKPRNKIMFTMSNTDLFKEKTRKDIEEVIYYNQYDVFEREYKGVKPSDD